MRLGRYSLQESLEGVSPGPGAPEKLQGAVATAFGPQSQMGFRPAGCRAGVRHTLRKGTEVGTQGLPWGPQRCALVGALFGGTENLGGGSRSGTSPGQLTQGTGLSLSPIGRPCQLLIKQQAWEMVVVVVVAAREAQGRESKAGKG